MATPNEELQLLFHPSWLDENNELPADFLVRIDTNKRHSMGSSLSPPPVSDPTAL
jgi:hypothetical protein